MHDPYISYAHNTLIPVVAAGELACWTVGTSGEWLKPNRSMSPPRRALGEVAAYVYIYIYNYSIVISTYIYITPKTERGSRDREKERRSDPGKIMSNLEQRLPTSGPII